MSRTSQAIAIAAGGLLLAGCQSMSGNSARLNDGIRVPEQPSGRVHAETQLAAGRAALSAHNYATAIAALREASLEPDFAAAAHNGLGVAYAGIGRNDLAERYFRQAAAEDPSEQRYADNLVRLYRARLVTELARRERLEAQRLAVEESERRIVNLGSGLRARGPERGMIRINRSEVVLRSSTVPTLAPRAVVREVARKRDDAQPASTAIVAVAQARSAPPALPQSESKQDPAKPIQQESRVAIAIESRREVANHHFGTAAAPAALSISTTGRRYENHAQVGPTMMPSASAPLLATTGRLVPLPTLVATIVGPMQSPGSILGQIDLEPPTEQLALAMQPPQSSELTNR
jgi:tetratricopeptide (TPR) repeat protein